MDEKINTGNIKSAPEKTQAITLEPKEKWTYAELFFLAENFASGEISATQVATIITDYSDFKKFKDIVQMRMKATADAMCDYLDRAAFERNRDAE